MIKKYTKVPFNYEYFKSNPNTELETKNSESAVRFIGESVLYNRLNSKLIFDSEVGIIITSINGKYFEGEENVKDIFMLVEVKETVGYVNVYDNTFGVIHDNLDEAIIMAERNAISVAKIITVNGKMTGFETVYIY